MGWKSDKIDGQKVYLTIFMSFLLGNRYRPEESGVDMSTPVHPVAPPLLVAVAIASVVEISLQGGAKQTNKRLLE